MKRRAFMGLGTTSIGVGALYGTGAFSAVSAGRGVSVNAVEDSDALLGIRNANDPDLDPEFTNRSGLQMVIEFDPERDGVTFDGEDPDDFSLSLDPNEERSVEIEADSSGVFTVSLDVTLFDDSGQKTGSILMDREFGVPQAAQISLTANIDNAGNSGKFRFEIENDGDIDVEINAVAVNYATVNDNPDPVRITDAMRDETGSNDAQGPIPVLNRAPDELDSEDFTPFSNPIPLDQGDLNDFEADKLEDEDGGNAKYNEGGTLDITLRLGDDSRAFLEMEL